MLLKTVYCSSVRIFYKCLFCCHVEYIWNVNVKFFFDTQYVKIYSSNIRIAFVRSILAIFITDMWLWRSSTGLSKRKKKCSHFNAKSVKCIGAWFHVLNSIITRSCQISNKSISFSCFFGIFDAKMWAKRFHAISIQFTGSEIAMEKCSIQMISREFWRTKECNASGRKSKKCLNYNRVFFFFFLNWVSTPKLYFLHHDTNDGRNISDVQYQYLDKIQSSPRHIPLIVFAIVDVYISSMVRIYICVCVWGVCLRVPVKGRRTETISEMSQMVQFVCYVRVYRRMTLYIHSINVIHICMLLSFWLA